MLLCAALMNKKFSYVRGAQRSAVSDALVSSGLFGKDVATMVQGSVAKEFEAEAEPSSSSQPVPATNPGEKS